MKLYLIWICIFLTFNGWAQGSSHTDQEVYTIHSITVSGNKVTNAGIITREITLSVGDSVSEMKLKEALALSKSNLINTNLFLEIHLDYHIDSLTNLLDILVNVKERWYWSILPNLTLADRNFNEWWYDRGRDLSRLTYGIDVRHANFTGNGDQFTTSAHFGFVPLYEVSYYKPYIDRKKRLGMSVNLSYAARRNLAYLTWNDKIEFFKTNQINYTRFGGSVTFRYRRNYNFFHTFLLGYTNNSISDSVAAVNPNYFGNQKTVQPLINFIYEYRMDYRDVRQYPLTGKLLVGSLGHYVAPQGMHQANILLRYSHFFNLCNKLFLELGARGKISFPREQSYYLVNGLGYGGNFARGYELYVVDGQYYLLSKNTLKYKAFEKTYDVSRVIKKKEFSRIPIALYPNVFLDGSYIRNFYPERSNSTLSNKGLLGWGLGLDLITFYNINIRSYYSRNQRNEGKIYFNIAREF